MKDQQNEQGPPPLPVTPEVKTVIGLLEKISQDALPSCRCVLPRSEKADHFFLSAGVGLQERGI